MQTDPTGAEWYTPKSQDAKPEEERTRYKIRGLLGTEAMDVTFHQDEGFMSMTTRGGNACLRCGLLGWERHTTDGKPLEFSEKDWKANIASLSPTDAIDLAIEIWKRTFLSEQARKN